MSLAHPNFRLSRLKHSSKFHAGRKVGEKRKVRSAWVAKVVAGALALLAAAVSSADALPAEVAETLRSGGKVIVLRHVATTAGVGDPPGMRLDDCATQRNLSDQGRSEARLLGERIREAGVAITKIQSSPWCRNIETGLIAFPGVALETRVELSNFIGTDHRQHAASYNAALTRDIANWRGPGVKVLIGHGTNITSLTGRSLDRGAFLVVEPQSDGFRVLHHVDDDLTLKR